MGRGVDERVCEAAALPPLSRLRVTSLHCARFWSATFRRWDERDAVFCSLARTVRLCMAKRERERDQKESSKRGACVMKAVQIAVPANRRGRGQIVLLHSRHPPLTVTFLRGCGRGLATGYRQQRQVPRGAGCRAAIRVREPYLRRRRGSIWTREAVG